MTIKELLVLALAVVCIVEVFADGHHSYMVPSHGGGGRKWSIRARGKGMQNMMSYSAPKHDHYEKKETKKEVVYVPVHVPVYQKHEEYKPSYQKHEEYKPSYDYKGYESSHGISILPMHGQQLGLYGGGYQ